VLSVNYRGEQGSAVVEFIGFGLLLQVPLMLFAISLVSLQHDQLAAEAITRDALRSYVLLNREPSETAMRLAADYRVPPNRIQLTVSCKPRDCVEEGSWIFVETKIGRASAVGVLQR
jgi:hypothetical protein